MPCVGVLQLLCVAYCAWETIKWTMAAPAPLLRRAEYDAMDMDMLCEVVPALKQKLVKQARDRNYAQIEMDMLQQFEHVTKLEIDKVEMHVHKASLDLEAAQKTHRIEMEVGTVSEPTVPLMTEAAKVHL